MAHGAERKSLIPANPKPGDRQEVAEAIRKRFYSTIGIDYMEGSVSALPTRKSTMSLTVDEGGRQRWCCAWKGTRIWARISTEAPPRGQAAAASCACSAHALRPQKTGDHAFRRRRRRPAGGRTNEIRLDQYPWMYGIACELVTGDESPGPDSAVQHAALQPDGAVL